jgi:hypothetical protein
VDDLCEHPRAGDAREGHCPALPDHRPARKLLPAHGAASLVHRDGEVALLHTRLEGLAARDPRRQDAAAAGRTIGGRPQSTSAEDRIARAGDVASGKEMVVLRGQAGPVTSAAFSSDGSRIVTASGDRTARAWDVRLYQLSTSDPLVEARRRLDGVTKLTRDETRLASYDDSVPQIDVCRE